MNGSARSRTRRSGDSTRRCSTAAAESPDAAAFPPPRSLYVHVPFCARRCAYCDFATAPFQESVADRYLDRLERELEQVPRGSRLDTVYLGGGTPTALTEAQLRRLLEAIAGRIELPVPEWTSEANPESLDGPRLGLLLRFGVNRVSLGTQSFQPATLAALGREHVPEHTFRALDLLRSRGVTSLSLDLMFAAPGQSEASLERDLETLGTLGLPHVSAYCLTYEPGTPLARRAEQGRVPRADEETELAQYRMVRAGLARHGLKQYEISSFARPGHESRHNQVYWEGREYYGIGLGAGSYVAGTRRSNTRDMTRYLGPWPEATRPPHEAEVLGPKERARETVILALRMTRGLEESALRQRTGYTLDELYDAGVLEPLLDHALVSRGRGVLRLTERGLELSDTVFAALV